MSTLIELADAVVATLNATVFSLPLTAVRAYLPRYELKDMATLHVTVVPKAESCKRIGRGQRKSDYALDIAVQQRAVGDGATDRAQADTLMHLCEEIRDAFDGWAPTAVAGAMCTAVDRQPLYVPEHFEEFRQFTGVLTLSFTVLA